MTFWMFWDGLDVERKVWERDRRKRDEKNRIQKEERDKMREEGVQENVS